MCGRFFVITLAVLALFVTPSRLPAQAAAPDSLSIDMPPTVTALTKDQVEKLKGFCTASGHRQRILPVIVDFLKLTQNDAKGFEAATVKFKNGDQVSFIQLGKAKDGYLFARYDGKDDYTYIIHVDADLNLVLGLKIHIDDNTARVTEPPVALSNVQAHEQLPKIFSEWIVVLDRFQHGGAAHGSNASP